MRKDSFGLFYEEAARQPKDQRARIIPSIPDTGWTAPSEFPRLDEADEICIDVETYDPDLFTKGPGWATGNGHVVGLAVGVRDARWYFPIRHEYGGGNMDEDMVLRWARDELSRPNQRKIGANIMYDLGWLRHEGVHVEGPFTDIQYNEPLIDEYRDSYALEALAQDYLGIGKEQNALYDWCAKAYGGKADRKQASNIYRAPVALVGPYAESDVTLPFAINDLQQKTLAAEDLLDLADLEHRLIPLLLEMRWRGVPVDVHGAERVREDFLSRETEISRQIALQAGFQCNIDAPSDLERAFKHAEIPIQKTPKGNPSFAAHILEDLANAYTLPRLILEQRRLAKARGTFIEGYILDKHHNGRIHCEFHPLRRDDAGTVSGRFSSSNPNLQNIPARDEEMKHLVRGLFLPEDGEQWFAPDYSQIEYRLLTHFALGPGAEEARERYRRDPTTDYHDMAHDIVQDITGLDLPRKPIKNINFGMVFGMGENTIVYNLGEGGADVLEAYHEGFPFVRYTANAAMNRAQRRGYIKTLLGRFARFPFWEQRSWAEHREWSRDKDYILDNYGSAQRAKTHKALNALTQGSAADLIKKAMVDLYEGGYPVPFVQVHDELGFSMPPGEKRPGGMADEIVHVMENAVQLKVPVLVDPDWGETWGDC